MLSAICATLALGLAGAGPVLAGPSSTAPSVGLASPGAVLSGPVALRADATASTGRTIAEIVFQRSPAGAGNWTTVATADSAPFSTTFDATAVADGCEDLQAIATDSAGEPGSSALVTALVANTPPAGPTACLPDVGQSLTGTLPLDVLASVPAGTTVASAVLQYRSPPASGSWTVAATSATTHLTVDTTTLPEGPIELRALVTDSTGATATSNIRSAVVANTAPAVSLADPGFFLKGTVTLRASASPSSGRTVSTVDIQYQAQGDTNWTTVPTSSSPPFSLALDSTSIPDGLYQLRAAATDSSGETGFSTPETVLVANTPPSVELVDPGGEIRGTVTLKAVATIPPGRTATVAFQSSPVGTGTWTTIETATSAPFRADFDTTASPDGNVDLRAVLTDSSGGTATSDVFTSEIANLSPTVAFANPGATLEGTVTLSATASSPSTSVRSIASVAFQRSPAGSGTWTTIATVAVAPYRVSFDTTTVADGAYDLRAVATDSTGASVESATRSVTIANVVPTVTLADPGYHLISVQPLTATVTAHPGRVVTSVTFQYADAGQDDWTTIATKTETASPVTVSVAFVTDAVPDGLYDLRALATDSAGAVGSSDTLTDRIVSSSGETVSLATQPTGLTVLHSTAEFTAIAASQGEPLVEVDLQRALTGTRTWKTVVTDTDASSFSDAPLTLDTTDFADGTYDFRAVTTDDLGAFAYSPPITGVTVDNTPPLAALNPPAAALTGRVTLTATADDGDGSGIASVQFQRATSGSGTWIPIGTSRVAPYHVTFDTATVPNGTYDLRVVATDQAGNAYTSKPVTGIAIANTASPPVTVPAIANMVVPAHAIQFLGTIAASADDETWAVGFTSGPPAQVAGSPLPYTDPGNQLVVLRYTDELGWQIVDVLRNADGTAYQLPTLQTYVRGAMTPGGEAWLWVWGRNADGTQTYSLFHRSPGGAFFADPAATSALGPGLLNLGTSTGLESLRVRASADGTVFGMLVAPGQQRKTISVPTVGGGSTSVSSALDYGVLSGSSWTLATANVPAAYSPRPGDVLTLKAGDVDAPGEGFGAVSLTTSPSVPAPSYLGRFVGSNWTYGATGSDAFDATGLLAVAGTTVTALGLYDSGQDVWVGAHVSSSAVKNDTTPGTVVNAVLRVDASTGAVISAWCVPALQQVGACDESLDPDHPAAVPDAVFQTASGEVAVALGQDFVDLFENDAWSRVAAPGHILTDDSLFTGPSDGWLAGQAAVGRWTPEPPASQLVTWPEANRSPLMSVALPPGSTNALSSGGALAVGLDGTALHFDPTVGWVIDPLPPRASHINVTSVAFAGPTSAFAVGQFGLILRWDGTSWSEDPQSISLTQAQLNGVAFDSSGQGWAVGAFGTILHFDGTSWSAEQPPPEDSGIDITSVAVAGSDVFAVAGGNLIERRPDGSWITVPASALPGNPAPNPGDLRVVAGLPDGGAVAAGRTVVLLRQAAGQPFQYAPQPIEGVAVAAAAARDSAGRVTALLSVAPLQNGRDVTGYPPGDGDLIRETAAGNWQDLSLTQYPGQGDLPGDGALKTDPVLGIAANANATSVWAVGGYAGTATTAGQGSGNILPARSTDWYTSSIWRYDEAGTARPIGLSPTNLTLPAAQGTVSFAFFSSPECNVQCAATLDAQPDVNLEAASAQIATFAQQPGGPAFAILGGNARGPVDSGSWTLGNGAFDFSHLDSLLAPLGSVPLYAAYGPLDAVPNQVDPTEPWASAFAGSPAPFGSGAAAPGTTAAGAGGSAGVVHRYYAFDATQNGGTLRVIVLDNSAGSLDASDPGQSLWLTNELADANSRGLHVIVAAGQPLRGSDAENAISAQLAGAGVSAVFTGDSAQVNEEHMVPDGGSPQIPEYEGASLGYQQAANNGVVWYDVSIDTGSGAVSIDAVPVIDSLSIRPLEGLTVARSSTLQFQAIARRPVGSLPATTSDSSPGIANYVNIPAPGCGARPCIQPTYTFSSSDPTIGNFVVPSSSGSQFPQLNADGTTTASPTSGLFCAFNTGTTSISVTTGLLTYSLPVTVLPGGFGPPCGTVFRPGVGRVVVVSQQASSPAGAGVPPAPPPTVVSAISSNLPFLPPPPAPPAASIVATPPPVLPPLPATPVAAPPVAPAPVPVTATPPTPVAIPVLPPPLPAAAPTVTPTVAPAPAAPALAVLPTPTPPPQPIPPGGAAVPGTAAQPSSAPRREKARKHASQSAFTIRPAGAGNGWFYLATGGAAIGALLLAALGLSRPGQERPAAAYAGVPPRRRPTR
jgi:hypothetical protein